MRERRRGGVGVEEGAEAELEEGGEAGVAGVDDLADVVDELRDGDPGAAAAADDVADDAVHPRRGGRRHLARRSRGRLHLHVRVVLLLLLERGELELGGQRGQLRAGGRLMRRLPAGTSGGGRDVGEVARDVAARRGEVHVGRRALADHGGGGGFLVVLC